MAVLPRPILALLQKLKDHPEWLDCIAFFFLHLAGFASLWIGVTVVIPNVFDANSLPLRAFNYAIAVLMFFGVFINLHMIGYRHSTIRNMVLTPPPATEVLNLPNLSQAETYDPTTGLVQNRRLDLTDQVKLMAEQFTAEPYNSPETWHICASCETFVPPRTWHCFSCNSCVLRRDHHCVLARACIGHDNHNNFLGMLVYLSLGTLYCTVLIFVDSVIIQKLPWWMWLLRSLAAVYSIVFDFSFYYIVASINFTGAMAGGGALVYYSMLACKGQTSADQCRKIKRSTSKHSEYTYENFRSFVGPNPFYRILWPFHTPASRLLQVKKDSSSTFLKMK